MERDKPAFPAEHLNLSEYSKGLTKREYFAAMAMQALVSDPQNGMWIKTIDPRFTGENFSEVVAKNSCEFADALINELQK